MVELSFARVRTCLYDPAYQNRQSTLGALQTLGFREIEPVARTRDLENALVAGGFDLAIAELQGQQDEICDIVRRVRHRVVGRDPFLVVLLTTWELTSETVRAVVNCGADDLLARPYTIAQLRQRIAGVAASRKPFVVTADYVGPSRRASTRAPEEDEVFAVPSSLQARTGFETKEGGAEAVEAAWSKVLRWKAVRLGRQLEASARMLKETKPADASSVPSILERISIMARDLAVYLDQAEDPVYRSLARESEALQKRAKVQRAQQGEIDAIRKAAEGVSARAKELALPRPVQALPKAAAANDPTYVLI